MNLADFDYELPWELIAQRPLEDRAASRMLVLDRKERRWNDRAFRDLPDYLRAGDCLVLNDSKVFPSRLYGHREGSKARIEVFLTRPASGDPREWTVLVRPGRKVGTGDRLLLDGGLEAVVTGRSGFGERTLRFEGSEPVLDAAERAGRVPLPPYIHRPDDAADRERYQTVFARERGSVAAPTAGLHFTGEMLERCRAAGAEIAYVTLHVGLGTFQPLRAEAVEKNHLHNEFYRAPPESRQVVGDARRRVAVGTTTVRTLESWARFGPEGDTDLFIYPGFEFRMADALLTNFHLPRSSLLLLVSAFAGTEFVLEAYRHAVRERYRFFSYGDSMLIV